jgi:Uma2 family endonuclease
MIAIAPEPVQRLRLSAVPWSSYEAILHAFDGRRLRITYDREELEIMTISSEHEHYKWPIRRMIEMVAFVLRISIRGGGSLTFRRESLERGLEPDECDWIQNAKRFRSLKEYDPTVDPPPDVSLEIDIMSSSVPRMPIYAALRVPEVWRFDHNGLTIHHLGQAGKYKVKNHSRAFPFLPIDEVRRFLNEAETMDDSDWVHAFHNWVRHTVLPLDTAGGSKRKKGTKDGEKQGQPCADRAMSGLPSPHGP